MKSDGNNSILMLPQSLHPKNEWLLLQCIILIKNFTVGNTI